MLGMLAAMLMQAAAQPTAPPADYAHPSVITNPDWGHGPSANDIGRIYPKAALAARLGGRATIHCGVAVTGDLTDCRVISEDPVGNGFGDAALALAPKFKMKPQLRDGVPTPNGQINLPIVFAPPRAIR